MASMTSLWNGERAVVPLFVSRVVFSLLSHASLSASSPSLPSTSRSASRISRPSLNSRPGASSGMLLGAVTQPSVLISKLIQMSRALSVDEVRLEEIDYIKMLYWVAWFAASPDAILVTQSWVCSSEINRSSTPHFPSCASVGEALLLTAGLVLHFGDMLTCTLLKVNQELTSLDMTFSGSGNVGRKIGIIIQFGANFQVKFSHRRAQSDFVKSLLFFTSLGIILSIIIPSWMQFVQDFDLHPILWIISYAFQDPLKRLSSCIDWVALIYASVSRFYSISKDSKVERILLRKYYHLMVVSVFSPALILQREFLDLAFGGALAVFLVLEIIRVWNIWPLGQPIDQFMDAFAEHRDSDLLIIRRQRSATSMVSLDGAKLGHWSSLLLAVVLSGLLEAYTAQLDNAFIPLVFYSLLRL